MLTDEGTNTSSIALRFPEDSGTDTKPPRRFILPPSRRPLSIRPRLHTTGVNIRIHSDDKLKTIRHTIRGNFAALFTGTIRLETPVQAALITRPASLPPIARGLFQIDSFENSFRFLLTSGQKIRIEG